MKEAFLQLTGFFGGPISEILFIHTSTHMKMGLVTEKTQQQHGEHVEVPNTIFQYFHFFFAEFLLQHRFAWYICRPFGKNSSQTSNRKVKGGSVFPCRMSWRQLNWNIYRVNIFRSFAGSFYRWYTSSEVGNPYKIVFRRVTVSCLESSKCARNALCQAVTDSFFFLINVSTMKEISLSARPHG